MAIVAYRDRQDGRYPISLMEVRASSRFLFGVEPSQGVLDEVGVEPVEAFAPPVYDPIVATISEGAPEKHEGVWRQTWLVSARPGPGSSEINAERDRRIRSGFTFGGVPFDYDDASQKRITGAATLAGFATASGAQPGDLRWHGGTSDFVWIAQTNALIPMDAPTCFAFGQAAAAWESANVFAAKAIKETSPVPANYADDALWPA